MKDKKGKKDRIEREIYERQIEREGDEGWREKMRDRWRETKRIMDIERKKRQMERDIEIMDIERKKRQMGSESKERR
jgi:hypothetical protein